MYFGEQLPNFQIECYIDFLFTEQSIYKIIFITIISIYNNFKFELETEYLLPLQK